MPSSAVRAADRGTQDLPDMRQVTKQIFIKFYVTFNFSHDHKYFTIQYSWNALPIKWQYFDNRRVD